MKPLDEHNRERRAQIERMRDSQNHTGIACPRCGAELVRTNPSSVCMSIPPQIAVHCACGFRGYAVA